jgi:hypothetical protein
VLKNCSLKFFNMVHFSSSMLVSSISMCVFLRACVHEWSMCCLSLCMSLSILLERGFFILV